RADTVLAGLTAEQLLGNRRIQGFETTGLGAIFDSVPHFNGHTQKIVFLTRLQLGELTPISGSRPRRSKALRREQLPVAGKKLVAQSGLYRSLRVGMLADESGGPAGSGRACARTGSSSAGTWASSADCKASASPPR